MPQLIDLALNGGFMDGLKRHFNCHLLIGLLLATLLSTGCQKKCQQPSAQKLRTFIDQEFRVVETTDPNFRNLTNTNFIIMVFRINYAGEVFKVENNDRFNNPALIFNFDVNPSSQLIRLQYMTPASEEGGEAAPSGGVKTYEYELGREFNLVEQGTGYTYRMVPFTGVVRPDQECVF